MDLGLKGKVALVSAASRGLGRAVAEELAAEGASLVLCARGAESLAKACADIERASGVQVLGVAGGGLSAYDGLRLGGDASDLDERAEPDARGAARDEGAALGAHPQRHLHRGQAAGREPDAVEQP